MRPSGERLRRIYGELYRIHGPQNWWSADTPFEMMAGAVLVQNTNWGNAQRALVSLKAARALSPRRVAEMPLPRLAALIRPSGTHRVKAKRLRALARWLVEQGGVTRAARLETRELRESLLAVHGVGPETADCILLYVFERPAFVADTYARRFLQRYGFELPEDYESARREVERVFRATAPVYNEFHALIVRHGKEHCGARPRCDACRMRRRCRGATGGTLE